MYAAVGNETEQPITLDQLSDFLRQEQNDSTELYVSLYADEVVPYKNIVEVLNVANELHLKMVLATRQPDRTQYEQRQ
jgi:biopolymer transport protein ExbD